MGRFSATLRATSANPTTAYWLTGSPIDCLVAIAEADCVGAAGRTALGKGPMDDHRGTPRKHLFVVNRSPDFLLIARDLFEEEGYGVTTNEFAPTVFARIIMRHPDALIVDLAPGDPAPWDLLERLHAEGEATDIPILVTSTSPRLLEQARAEYGARHSCLAKPMDLGTLLGAVREMIGNP
jgi:CheY-like chemotaxis protein